ncbi:hypothetical protein [Streptomyces palmae]|uniref:Uncharacterized protein n=1 Tax=Streptomyces palmae TaxID=1701085 RepID=A0A4Z0FT76_9ACTN|nr:hypothetical protein [Streptomyces palmae]TGA85367.1 hypothetical protein E4099_30950 [Streptomyces palmae]
MKNFFGLGGGNDKALAAQYAGQESASSKAGRKRLEGHRRDVAKTDRQGWAWADNQRMSQDRRGRRP